MKIFLLISLSLFLLLALPAATFAADSFRFEQNKFFLQTSGQNPINETVLIKNQTTEPIKLKLNWESFSNPKRAIDFANLSTRELTIQPFATAAVELSLTTPANLGSGDYYGALIAKSEAETKKASITLRFLGSLAQKVLLQSIVPGSDSLKLNFENQGNITSAVSGKLIITDIFGRVVVSREISSFDIRASEKLSKNLSVGNLFPGYYQTKVELSTGKSKVNQTSISSFWAKPIVFVVLLLCLGIILMSAGAVLWRKLHG